MAEQLVALHPELRHVIVDGDPGPFMSWSGLPAGDAPQIAADTAFPALLLVSGGTTGAPKLIPRTHDDYVYNATASAQLCRLTSDDVYLVSLPAAHNFPLACPGLLGAMTVGATTVFGTDPSPEAAFAAIERHGVTVTALVPALAKLWAQACDWEPVTPKSLRLLQVGGAKLEPEDARQVRAALTPGLQQVFGMAEGLLNYTRLDDPPELRRPHPRAAAVRRRRTARRRRRRTGRWHPARKANCWCAGRTRSTATSAPSATTSAASIPTASTAAATWSAAETTATWWSPVGSKTSSAAAAKPSPLHDLEEQLLSHSGDLVGRGGSAARPLSGRKDLRRSCFRRSHRSRLRS